MGVSVLDLPLGRQRRQRRKLVGVVMVRVTGKRLFAWTTGVMMVVSFARTSVLFLESMAAVREERNADAELLDVCASGAARSSAKMRAACLQAQADRASPLVLKAIVRAVGTAWHEFRDSVATPFGFATMILFVLSSVLLPIIPWIRAILTAWVGDDEDEPYQDNHRDGDLEHHVIVLAGDNGFPLRAGMRKRMARMLKSTSNGGVRSRTGYTNAAYIANGASRGGGGNGSAPSYVAFDGQWSDGSCVTEM